MSVEIKSPKGEIQHVEPFTVFQLPDQSYALILRRHNDLWNSVALCVPLTKANDASQGAPLSQQFDASLPANHPLFTRARFNDSPKDEGGAIPQTDVRVDFSNAFLLDMNKMLKAGQGLKQIGMMDDPPSVSVVKKNNAILINSPLWRQPAAFQEFQEKAYPEEIVIPANTVYTGALARITHPQAKAALLKDLEDMRVRVQKVLDADPSLTIREARDQVLHGDAQNLRDGVNAEDIARLRIKFERDNELLEIMPDSELHQGVPLDRLVNAGLLSAKSAERLSQFPTVGALCAEFDRSQWHTASPLRKLDASLVETIGAIAKAHKDGTLELGEPEIA